MKPASGVDVGFTKSLPKAELHAHLSGSISSRTLHEIWKKKQDQGQSLHLEDPITAIQAGSDGFVNIASFFPLFDKYIYNLCNDLESVKYAMDQVIKDFEADGVRYLELRTTPRENVGTGMTKESYVSLVNDTAREWNEERQATVEVHIILSIDRSMTLEKAVHVVDLAMKYQRGPNNPQGQVVGLDLCGNPCKGDVEIFTPAFRLAKENNLGVTVHFAEVPASATDHELSTILSWHPDRLGHSIHVPAHLKEKIVAQSIGLEMCLSCNVLTGMTHGSFERHHLGEWLQRDCPIALSTDDVGVFGSSLSNEYLLASGAFHLSRTDLIKLSRDAVHIAFAGRGRMKRLLDEFEKATVV